MAGPRAAWRAGPVSSREAAQDTREQEARSQRSWERAAGHLVTAVASREATVLTTASSDQAAEDRSLLYSSLSPPSTLQASRVSSTALTSPSTCPTYAGEARARERPTSQARGGAWGEVRPPKDTILADSTPRVCPAMPPAVSSSVARPSTAPAVASSPWLQESTLGSMAASLTSQSLRWYCSLTSQARQGAHSPPSLRLRPLTQCCSREQIELSRWDTRALQLAPRALCMEARASLQPGLATSLEV